MNRPIDDGALLDAAWSGTIDQQIKVATIATTNPNRIFDRLANTAMELPGVVLRTRQVRGGVRSSYFSEVCRLPRLEIPSPRLPASRRRTITFSGF